jgi:putative spermidine/putrescine transport system permease protein
MGGKMSMAGGVLTPPAEGTLGDHASLKVRLRRAERMRKVAAFGLVAPLLLFVIVSFALPIAGMLWRSVEDVEVSGVMPRTIAALKTWDGVDLPSDEAFRAAAVDLAEAKEKGTVSAAARRLNYDINGFRTIIMTTARRAPAADVADIRGALIDLDKRWGERETWAAIKRAKGPLTDFYLLAAVDMQHDATGSIVRSPEERAIYMDVLGRTFRISLTVTLLCLFLAFPVAYLMSTQPARIANILMILVLLPFWTSLLVRTAAWVVLLQNEGLVNHLLIWLGIIDAPIRLIYNSIGVHVAMTHVLLPFMILPLYSTMKAIKPHFMRAAISLGAPPPVAFLRVYLPQCLPGIAAGCLLVFILSIGYYITPALVGGAGDQMLSYFIAFYTTDSVNWGMASALGAVLLGTTMVLYGVYSRLVGGGAIKMG